MHGLENLHFLRPWMLLALPIALFAIWHLHKYNNKQDAWSKICDPHLLDAIKVKDSAKGSQLSKLLFPIFILAILALAGPAFRKQPTPLVKNQSALIIALDVSKSMLSDDLKPNRLERAKFKINDILESRKDGQTALIVYAGDAFVVTPLTDDTETIALMLKALNPNIMPVQGSRADIALEKAKNLLTQADYFDGEVLLITDGINSSRTQSKAEELIKDNIKTSVLAVGTLEGAPIPYEGGFVKDRSGNIVIPRLNISELSEVAADGKGRFALISGDNSDINYLVPEKIEEDLNAKVKEDENSNFETQKFIDDGPWLILLVLPLFALLYRKGVLFSVFLVFMLQVPQKSYALEWDDLWLNADQKAAKHLQNKNPELAFEEAKTNSWKASAAYKKKDFEKATELFSGQTADDFYNKGNALAQSGELEKALDSYNKSLALRPDNEDTLFNKDLVEKALEQQKQQQKDQQDQEKQDQEQDQDQDQDQEKQDQQNQDSSDQQDQDSEENQDQQQSENKDSEDGEQQSQESKDNPQQQEQEKQQGEMTEEEKKQQEQEQKALEQADKEQAEKEAEQQKQQQVQEQLIDDAEKKEAIEQWLRRIPDDPGGLLRRKFYYQYNQQNNKPDENEDW